MGNQLGIMVAEKPQKTAEMDVQIMKDEKLEQKGGRWKDVGREDNVVSLVYGGLGAVGSTLGLQQVPQHHQGGKQSWNS